MEPLPGDPGLSQSEVAGARGLGGYRNVPISLLSLGRPEEVKEYCRGLIKAVGEDGGFILDPGAGIDTARAENLQAMIEAARESEG